MTKRPWNAHKRIRIWWDELTRLPEYNLSVPGGVCHGKTWRRTCQSIGGVGWWVCQYWDTYYNRDGKDFKRENLITYEVELLQGPRRQIEPMRFTVDCSEIWKRERKRQMFPDHISREE